jgi:hypothetical protein
MSNDNWLELHSSLITAGTYSVNSFFIRANSFADLDPGDEEPLKNAVSVHAHEYVHFLHNISTCSGLHLFIANLWLMRTLVLCTDNSGQSLGDNTLTKEQKTWPSSAVTWILALQGTVKWGINGEPSDSRVKWYFEPPVSKIQQIEMPPQVHDMALESVSGIATNTDNEVFHFSIDIGYNLITEGIAYEVDREIRRENGTLDCDLDQCTPPYPYLAYGALIDHLLDRHATARERIFVGVAALQSSSPAASLIEICGRLQHLAPNTASSATDSLLAPIDLGNTFAHLIQRTLEPEIKALGGSPAAPWGGYDVLALFKEGFKLRSANGVLEFAFIGRPMDKNAYRSCVATMVDCCVLQAKPDDKVILEWVGPGIVAKTDDDAARIGVFQASLHFAGLHVLQDGRMCATSTLPPRVCPYSGACQAEIDDGMPDACRTRPWTRYQEVSLGGHMCWYAAGVKTFSKQAQQPPKSNDTAQTSNIEKARAPSIGEHAL